MYCPRCGFDNEPGKKFCTKCGARLGRESAGGRAGDAPRRPSRTETLPDPLTGDESGGVPPLKASREPVKALPIALTCIGAFILLIGFFQTWGVMKVTGLLGCHDEAKVDLFAVLSIDDSGAALFLLLICAVPLYLGLISLGTGCGGALSRYGDTGSALVGFQAASVVGLLSVALIVAFMRGFAERLVFEAVRSMEDSWAVTGVVLEMGPAYKFLIAAFVVSGAGAVANALPIFNSGERRKVNIFIVAGVAGTAVIGVLTIAAFFLITLVASGLS